LVTVRAVVAICSRSVGIAGEPHQGVRKAACLTPIIPSEG
jgi:hypothetical protein